MILHADLDAFYASVEQLLDPGLRGRAIAVGGSERGGVVLAASYEARRFGVSGGMPGRRARELCPGLLFVRGHFDRYQELADEVIAVMHDFTPEVERISIDEAFLDVRGATHLFGPPEMIAAELRERVRAEVGLPISVGVARTKHLAKVASQVAKPDGLVVVEPGGEREFLEPLPVGLMWGVGPVAKEKLASEGIRTIGELARASPRSVERLIGGAAGAKLSALANDRDPRRVETARRAHSVGAQSALGRRKPSPETVRPVLSHLADRVAGRLRAKHRAGRTVTVRVRFPGLRSVTRSLTLGQPISTTLTLTEIAEQLAWQAIEEQPEREPYISLLAISVSNLVVVNAVQAELPLKPDDPHRPGSVTGASRMAIDEQVDAVRRKFGRDAVAYLPVALERRNIPDEFRELAEREL